MTSQNDIDIAVRQMISKYSLQPHQVKRLRESVLAWSHDFKTKAEFTPRATRLIIENIATAHLRGVLAHQ